MLCRCSITGRSFCGSTISVARARWKLVSSTESGSIARSSCAVSSSPVASGTGGVPGLEHVDGGTLERRVGLQQLLGADGVVAGPPAGPLVPLDLLAQP